MKWSDIRAIIAGFVIIATIAVLCATAHAAPYNSSYTGAQIDSSVKTFLKGNDVASNTTINLTSATGGLIDVTGTTAITGITLAEGQERVVRFTGILTLTHGASLVLPGGANITTAAGDFAVFRGYSSGIVRCVTYTKASGLGIAGVGSLSSAAVAVTDNAVVIGNGSALVSESGSTLAASINNYKCFRFTDPTDTADVVAGTNKGRIHIPYASTISHAFACLNTTGGTDVVTVDLNKTGTGTILSTKLTIDPTEKCSNTAAAPVVISDTAVAAYDEFTMDVDDDDGSNTAAGLEVVLCVY